MSSVVADFDRLAQLDAIGWTANNQYHDFLLRHVPPLCTNVLEIGCGTGAFSRRLAARAKHVLTMDLSPEMIRVARSRSAHLPNIDFEIADATTRAYPQEHFDCIVTIATLHHLPQRELLMKLKDSLKPSGKLIVLDLFQPERSFVTIQGWCDSFVEPLRMGASVALRLIHNGRLRPPREVRAAWKAHGKTDRYLRMREVRSFYGEIFPGVMIRKHLLWRYSIVWQKH